MEPADEFARHYLEDLLSFFGLNTRVEATQDNHTIELKIPSTRLNGFLIGARGQNLRSLQHLANMALKAKGYDEVSAVLDVAGYKAQQNQRLAKRVAEIAAQVKQSGEPYQFDQLSAYERRVVHQAVTDIEGVTSESSGEGAERRLTIKTTQDA